MEAEKMYRHTGLEQSFEIMVTHLVRMISGMERKQIEKLLK